MVTPDTDEFDWIPFYEELADRLVPFRTQQQQLIDFLRELRAEGLKILSLEDEDEAGNRLDFDKLCHLCLYRLDN
jgi:hypothetical protein